MRTLQSELSRLITKKEVAQELMLPKSLSLEVVNQIIAFTNAISKQIHIRQIVLYGSQATGKAHRWSDIDLAIISDDFSGWSNSSRKALLAKAAIQAKTNLVQSIGYSPSEWFSNCLRGFPKTVKQSGIIILNR